MRKYRELVCTTAFGLMLGCAGAAEAPGSSTEEDGAPDGASAPGGRRVATDDVTQDAASSADFVRSTPSAVQRLAQPDDIPQESPSVMITPSRASDVLVNGVVVPNAAGLPPGDFWYDRLAGFWGHRGYRASGIAQSGLDIGGPLRADASGGTSELYLNARELTDAEALELQLFLLPVLQAMLPPGRYGLDGSGWFGVEGRAGELNLVLLAQYYQQATSLDANSGWSTNNSYGNSAGACFEDTGCVFF